MRNQLFTYMRANFGFSRGEARGFILLCVFTIALMSTPFLMKQYYVHSVPESINETLLLDELTNDLTNKRRGNNPDSKKSNLTEKSEVSVKKRLFVFDPNSISAIQFQELGLEKKLSERIINYRNHGGVFRKREDLKKIYGLSAKQYIELEPYIEIPKIENSSVPAKKLKPVKSEKKMLDINIVDSIGLLELNGIGSTLAGRIVKFRNQLGGFYTVDQLAEVYGLKEETLNQIQGQFWVANDFEPSKISLSSCSYEILRSHPYLRKYAGAIMKLKRSEGKAINKESLLEKGLTTETEYQRLLPYLSD